MTVYSNEKEARAAGLKPGSVYDCQGPNDKYSYPAHIPWRVEDLDPSDTVEFVPQNVESLHFPQRSVNNKPVLAVDVNNLKALYEVGTPTTSNRFFYNAYTNALDQAIALQEFKKHGPDHSPWATWVYIPMALSFGIDLEGKSLRGKEWYELDKDGIPIAINNIKKLTALYFSGDINLNLTRQDVAELLFMVIKIRVRNFINKLRRKK